MTQAPPFGSGLPQTPLLPPGTTATPESAARGGLLGLGRGRLVAAGAGLGVVVLGGAWFLLGSGGDDADQAATPLSSHRFASSPSASPSGSSALLLAAATRDPFAGSGGGAVSGAGATGSPAGGSATGAGTGGPSPTTAPSVPASPSTVPAVTTTVTATVKTTVTVTPAASPSAIYVGLYAWTAGNDGDFRVNETARQAAEGATFDGVTYVRQNPADAQGRLCAVVRLAGADATGEKTLCVGDVTRLQ